ncbi:MAG TPA: ABC transporter permease subunit/CPBP intramembrane protease [Pirellulaceae bacterium]|nr:ABC transporter permease subunit/CPBP intramembrane protease [Pirellulaceae bacterium]
MTEHYLNSATAPISHRRRPSFFRLAQKELRETLRDRRTLLTLILMPLLVYPLLSLGFRSFLVSSTWTTPDDDWIRYRIGVQSDLGDQQFLALCQQIEVMTVGIQPRAHRDESTDQQDYPMAQPSRRLEAPFSQHRWLELKRGRQAAQVLMEQGELDLFVELNQTGEDAETSWSWELTFDPSVPISRNAARLVREHLELANRLALQQRIGQLEGDQSLPLDVVSHPVDLKLVAGQGPNLAAIIPLVLVLMTITGAVYPAIDLTAGERERGTLETLVAAPIPRMTILIAKMTAVLTVSVLTAVLNLGGMLGTIWAFGLERMLLGPDGLTIGMAVQVLGLLLLFAVFFSAVMLVITSFARSFKEAQAYLVPLILLSLGPGLLTLTPGMELTGPWAVVPMMNILLLARDVLQGQFDWVPATVAVVSTAIYAAVAVALAASLFGSDSILYGGQASWIEMFSRPAIDRELPSHQTALFCLLLLFPLNFVLIGVLSRIETSIETRLIWMAGFTAIAFFVVPALLAAHQRIKWRTGFGLRVPNPWVAVCAVVLGISLWPLVMSILTGWQHVLSWLLGDDAASDWAQRLVEFSRGHVERFREAPILLIAVAFSLVPALCEEWFFRGMLLRSLLGAGRPMIAIVFSAVAFGAFHTLSGGIAMFDRFLTTTLVGLVLGWIAYRTNSIVPGILLHAVHNACVFGLAYFHRELSNIPGFPEENQPVPISWVIAAAIITTAMLISIAKIQKSERLASTS